MGENNMSINLINYALAKKDWKKAYEDLKVLEVGGRNLLTGTSKEFKKINIGNFTTLIPNGRFDMGGVLNVGDTVTIRAYIKAPQGRKSAVRITEYYSDGSAHSAFIGNFVSDGYSALTHTIGERNPNVSYILLQFQNDKPGENSTYDIEYKEVKLEKGNRATDWTPAPDDINAHPFVAELAESVFRSKQNDWEKAYEDLKVLGVGGRNLLRNSKGPFIVEPRNTGNAADNFNFYHFYCDMELNETYTISADIEITHGDFDEVTVLPFPGGAYSAVPIPSNGRIKHTFVKTSETIDSVLIYAGLSGSTRGQGIIIRNVKIEKGNKATDWTPAPEDINAHPFVAELAETVFRSKQNEERIRNLENAITALGGGS